MPDVGFGDTCFEELFKRDEGVLTPSKMGDRPIGAHGCILHEGYRKVDSVCRIRLDSTDFAHRTGGAALQGSKRTTGSSSTVPFIR